MYAKFFKRLFDIVLSFLAIIVLSPILLMLTVAGAFVMKGNPFFTQERPGKDEKIFKLIKFRSMTNAKDKNGNLLPDSERLTKYGKLVRATSLDELPELFNILKGDMSIIGPRPLLVSYLDLYGDLEHSRHNVRPGLTGLAQASGRNGISWKERFELDKQYVDGVSFVFDIKILFMTVKKVFIHEGINFNNNETILDYFENKNRQEVLK